MQQHAILYEKTTPVFHAIRRDIKNYRILVEQGGTHSSKTYSTMQMFGEIAITEKRKVITVTGQDMPNLRRGANRDFETILQSSKTLRSKIVKITQKPLLYLFNTGTIIEFESYENPQDAESGKRDYLFVNECDGISYELFNTLRIKTKERIVLDYNAKQPFWVHDKLLGTEGVIRHISNFTHNPYISEAVLADIMSYKDNDTYRWNVYGLGLTGLLKEQTWLHAFNGNKHVKPVSYIPTEPVYISVDFNYGKYVAIAYQCSGVDKEKGSFFHIIKEFVLKKQTSQALAAVILQEFGHNNIFLTGDQSGAKHDVSYSNSNDTQLSILKEALNLGNKQMLFGSYHPKRYDKANPSHANSWAHCNNALSLHPRFIISPTCTELINDCRIAMIDEKKGNYSLKKGAGDGVMAMNAFDCLRYAINTSLPSYRKIGRINE